MSEKEQSKSSGGVGEEKCTNIKCKCPDCTCGVSCTCGISLDVSCDPCNDFKKAAQATQATQAAQESKNTIESTTSV
jgi:hypothetical protein